MTYLIATDEAGYGPPLGPLVIVATSWQLDDGAALRLAVSKLSEPIDDVRCESVKIGDSKQVFRRCKQTPPGRLPILDEVCGAASRWTGVPDPRTNFADWLRVVAANDYAQAIADPWFRLVPETSNAVRNDSADDEQADQRLIDHWTRSRLSLGHIAVRFITPRTFNAAIDRGLNKADLLTELTCDLAVKSMRLVVPPGKAVTILSDRHGGRSFYAGAIQHACGGDIVDVMIEGKPTSQYQVRGANPIDWSFSVSGDSVAPVAMSSLIAKWVRERAMADFNLFFAGRAPRGVRIRPTAGYPNDASRFLRDLDQFHLRRDIGDVTLIRCR